MMSGSRVEAGWLRWSTVTAIYACLTVAYAWPLIVSIASALPNDTGDPGLLSYLMWWNAHAVPFTDRWWNAPMFYPVQGALAFSDTLLGVSPFTTPLIWAGVSAVAVHNTLFIAAIFTAALAGHALGYRLTGRHDAALIAGLTFGFHPYRASQMPHVQLLVTCWMALALYALHRYLDRRRPTDLILLGVCWALNGLISGYYLVFFAVLIGVWMVWFLRERRDWIVVSGTLIVASLPMLPVLAGHHRIQAGFEMARSREEIEAFSADVLAFFSAPFHTSWPHMWTFAPWPEGELYLGIGLMATVMAGAVVAWRHLPSPAPVRLRRWLFGAALAAFALAIWSAMMGGSDLAVISFRRPYRVVSTGVWLLIAAALCDRRLADAWRRRSVFAFYVLAAVAMGLLALGPEGRVAGFRFLHRAPYSWLMELPGGDSLRVPARFAMVMVLCLSAAAALALARLAPRGVRKWPLIGLALVVLADGWVPNMLVAKTTPLIELPGLEPGTAVLEVPMPDLWTDTAAMLRATKHGYPLVNGFSGYVPPHYNAVIEGIRDADASIITAWRHFSPLAVLVTAENDPEGRYEKVVSGAPDAIFAYRTAVGPVYRFPALGSPPDPAGSPLPIVRVTANKNPVDASKMIDGSLVTQWKNLAAQAPGDQIVVTLDTERPVAHLVMDLADARLDYPRELRVEARHVDGRLETVWHAGTAGFAALAALRDRERLPVVIPLPANTTASELILTLTDGHKELYWTVAELRVYGR